MNPDEKELLQKTYELAKENNHIVKGIRSSNRWSTFFRLVYWTVIIAASVGAFYFIQPYINVVEKEIPLFFSDFNSVKSLTSQLPSFTTSSK